ncbi:hypothetical protein C1645_766520 [Glomus cerebriforme]|uniref:Uncharacterized protein n=1 Tax=Glomus cerebriforme TaxID=658196 RepID=A0A397T4F0_9GLOM|nr:hypothetical protein C1645_766520 [Glomus cerebriforme]
MFILDYFKISGSQNNQAEDPQTRKELEFDNPLSDRDRDNSINGIKQELINKDGRIKLLEEELKKMNENYNGLGQSFQTLREELSEEKKKNNKLNQSLQRRDDELIKEKQKSKNGILTFKTKTKKWKEYEKQMEKDYKQKLKSSEDYYQSQLDELKKRYDELELAKENMKKDMEINIENLEQQQRDQKRNFMQEFKKLQESHKKNINNIRQKLDEKGNGLRELEDENAKLREEASKYQSALGVATNIRLDDNDQNHSVKLKNDILKLQNTLENYVTHLKPNIDLDIKQIQNLAQKYGCLNEITEQNPNKLFIKTILQREVLDVIHKLSRELINYVREDFTVFTLESDIETKAQELLRLINIFSTTRSGTDEVTNASIIKIRQKVYGILGNRGFNNIIDSDGSTRMHDFIHYASDELNKLMNQYRKIKDVSREQQVEAMAPKLIQDIFKLFWFRMKVQEPITEFYFPDNDKIDPNTMRGTWNDDEIDQLCVDICYFPLIGRNLNSSNSKIYTLAKVFPRNIRSSDETNEEIDE